jgi:hypothetical protein
MAGDVFVAAQLLSCRRIVLPTRFHAQCDGRSTKPGGDSTDDLPITSRSLPFRLDPPRPSWLLRRGTDSIQTRPVAPGLNAWVAREVATMLCEPQPRSDAHSQRTAIIHPSPGA